LMEEEEQEELVGGLLSSLEHLFFPNNSSQDKIRNQVEKEELLGRYTSLASETLVNAGKRGYLSGYLNKQGHLFKTWRRRFFILNDAERLLFYYSDPKAGDIKGVIELEGADVLRDVTRGKDLCFQISYPRRPTKRRFLLYAENKRDLQLWLKALTHAACSGISRRVEPSGFRADGPDAEIRSHTTFIFSTSSLEARLRRCRSVSASLVKKSPAEASTESLAQSPPSPSSPLMSPCSPPQRTQRSSLPLNSPPPSSPIPPELDGALQQETTKEPTDQIRDNSCRKILELQIAVHVTADLQKQQSVSVEDMDCIPYSLTCDAADPCIDVTLPMTTPSVHNSVDDGLDVQGGSQERKEPTAEDFAARFEWYAPNCRKHLLSARASVCL